MIEREHCEEVWRRNGGIVVMLDVIQSYFYKQPKEKFLNRVY